MQDNRKTYNNCFNLTPTVQVKQMLDREPINWRNEMPMYRKKPVVIEAKQATGTPESNREIIDWTRGSKTPASMDDHPERGRVLSIATLEGAHWVTPGDYVIRGVQGEFYPCKPDIFSATYEPALAV